MRKKRRQQAFSDLEDLLWQRNWHLTIIQMKILNKTAETIVSDNIDKKEAQAADSEEERFGYWCRRVRKIKRIAEDDRDCRRKYMKEAIRQAKKAYALDRKCRLVV